MSGAERYGRLLIALRVKMVDDEYLTPEQKASPLGGLHGGCIAVRVSSSRSAHTHHAIRPMLCFAGIVQPVLGPKGELQYVQRPSRVRAHGKRVGLVRLLCALESIR